MTPASAGPLQVGSMFEEGRRVIEANRAQLIALRRDLHRHPEPSGEEARTAATVAARLAELGFTIQENVAGHGVVGVLAGSRPGPTVAFRADLDAVRMSAPDPAPFRTGRDDVRHACGHDIHVTIALALAEAFASIRRNLPGTVVLIFQPSEETAVGARAMVEAGVMSRYGIDAVFAVHTAPLETGFLAVAESRMLVARDGLSATVSGEGADVGARTLRDRIVSLANVASGFAPQPLGSDFIYVEAAAFPGNGAPARVDGLVSLATDQARADARLALDDLLVRFERDHPSLAVDLRYRPGLIPGVVNNAALVEEAVRSARSVVAPERIIMMDQITPAFSEDFGHMQAVTPGVMFFLGVNNLEKGWAGVPHSPDYVADEEAIFVGAQVMLRVMLDQLHPGGS